MKKTNKPEKAKSMQVNMNAAPKELEAFKKWHPKACPRDPMTAENRFKQLTSARKEAEK